MPMVLERDLQFNVKQQRKLIYTTLTDYNT